MHPYQSFGSVCRETVTALLPRSRMCQCAPTVNGPSTSCNCPTAAHGRNCSGLLENPLLKWKFKRREVCHHDIHTSDYAQGVQCFISDFLIICSYLPGIHHSFGPSRCREHVYPASWLHLGAHRPAPGPFVLVYIDLMISSIPPFL